jgi:hypothetical protein
MNIMLRPCPTTCTPAERTKMNTDWFDAPRNARAGKDGRTWYVETARDAKGRYTLDVSHFFGDSAGAKLRWQVGVWGGSPPEGKELIQKIINDVYSQTP